tara:strand:- start:328 stop:795 length:468 start_codon:yes stop_codon:yes gene_type:complete
MFIPNIYILLIINFFLNFSYSNSIDLTIEIDGSNLPIGEGSIQEGEKIFKNECSVCHGFSAEGLTAPELAGGSTNLDEENISLTVGNYWPFAPKIFDYIRRSKRSELNKYYNNNEVYSLTGYLLSINGLYNEKKINKDKLSNITMPNLKGFISNY